MIDNEHNYLKLLVDVATYGEVRSDRTGVGTVGTFGTKTQYDMDPNRFPVLTSKKIHWKSVVVELLWFLRGDTNIEFLNDYGVTIWDAWADENGELGEVYGKQWRQFPKINAEGIRDGHVDQINDVLNNLKNDPYSRRHLVVAYNPGMVHLMALPPCHSLFQFYVREGEYLDCQLYQRSADLFLGVPFNIASYALLSNILALKLDLKPGQFHHVIGDAHVYSNHLEQVAEQVYEREVHTPPKLEIDAQVKDLDWHEMTPEMFRLVNYNHSGALKAEIAV